MQTGRNIVCDYLVVIVGGLIFCSNAFCASIVSDTVYSEVSGVVAVEAEHYQDQHLAEVRRWYRIDASTQLAPLRDVDTAFFQTASGLAYLEVLPDTRSNHDEKLIHGKNFSDKPGKLAILEYAIHFQNTGRYYVWVRAHSTGTEDNGIHVGLDDKWPDSGQRMQWCVGKHTWAWASKQRTVEEHCGVERLIYLDVETPGLHIVAFSMREDGFEFDKFVLSKDYKMPIDVGPAERVFSVDTTSK